MPVMQIGSLVVQLNRKAIKHLHISVLPPDGRVSEGIRAREND